MILSQSLDPKTANPIFIVGAPRSGTSLLRNILNRHPSIGLCDETYFFYYVFSRKRAFGDLADEQNRAYLIKQYIATTRMKGLGMNSDLLQDTLMREGLDYGHFFLSLIKFYASQSEKSRYGEKTPQHTVFATTLFRWYPKAKHIHLIRDPRDVVASLIRMPWGSKNPMINARIWVNSIRAMEPIMGTHAYLRVYYENLVNQPAEELERICKFINEDYVPVMLNVSKDPFSTESNLEWWFQRAKQPLDQSRLGKWRDELSSEQVAIVEWVAGQSMAECGYKLNEKSLPLSARINSTASMYTDRIQHKSLHWKRSWYYWATPTELAREETFIDNNKDLPKSSHRN